MAYQTIKYACGNILQKQMMGNAKKRQSYADYMANRDCGLFDCDKCGQPIKDHREAQALEGADQGMIGSPKQISWAMDIKDGFIRELDKIKKGVPQENLQKFEELMGEKFKKILANKNAKDWIENRGVTPTTCIRIWDMTDVSKLEKTLIAFCG